MAGSAGISQGASDDNDLVVHAIIGTAGHIDHGKTALIKALTGQDTDRLQEEKARGISIELGFAWMTQPDGRRAGIVDVPGHERFIRNMLAGAHGIDLVLFTVAADDGVMPQTEEHLDIVHLLGTKRGIFVITKADLADGPGLWRYGRRSRFWPTAPHLSRHRSFPFRLLMAAGLMIFEGKSRARLAGLDRGHD